MPLAVNIDVASFDRMLRARVSTLQRRDFDVVDVDRATFASDIDVALMEPGNNGAAIQARHVDFMLLAGNIDVAGFDRMLRGACVDTPKA